MRPRDPRPVAATPELLLEAYRRGLFPAQVALAWVLTRPGIDAPLFGATRVRHVDEAVDALSVTLTAAEVRSLEAAYAPKALPGTTG